MVTKKPTSSANKINAFLNKDENQSDEETFVPKAKAQAPVAPTKPKKLLDSGSDDDAPITKAKKQPPVAAQPIAAPKKKAAMFNSDDDEDSDDFKTKPKPAAPAKAQPQKTTP